SARVRELRPIIEYFTVPFWSGAENGPSFGMHYRPLMIYSLALDYRLHGESPAGFHLTNLILHALNVVLVFLLARRRGGSGPVAAFVALCFGVSPRLAEAAAWISGRTDLLAALFALLALVLWQTENTLRRWLSAACLLLGLFSKEVAIAALAALAVFGWLETR